MENLSLFSLSNTSLFHLLEGERIPLLASRQLDIILVELKDPLDVETLGLNYLCFLTWLVEEEVLSLPLLSGATVTCQRDGFLVMLGPKMIYFLEFPNSPTEIFDSFKLVVSEFTRVNSLSLGKTLPEQLAYISEKEQGHPLAVSPRRAKMGPGETLVKASEYLQFAIISTAQYSGRGIQSGANFFISNTSQGEYQFPQGVKKGLDMIANLANNVSGVAKSWVDTTSDFILHGSQSNGNVRIPQFLKSSGTFFLQTLESFGNVSGGIIEGSEIIIGDLNKSTVDVATHRYGQHVGQAAEAGLKAFQNSSRAVLHMTTFIHPTRFARAITHTTGKKIAAGLKKEPQGVQEVKSEISLKSLASIAANPSFTHLPRRSNERIVVSLAEIQKTGLGSEENLLRDEGKEKEKERENPEEEGSEGRREKGKEEREEEIEVGEKTAHTYGERKIAQDSIPSSSETVSRDFVIPRSFNV